MQKKGVAGNSYDYIIPAYHMNKQHWNTIIISENVDEKLVKELVEQSYELTRNSNFAKEK